MLSDDQSRKQFSREKIKLYRTKLFARKLGDTRSGHTSRMSYVILDQLIQRHPKGKISQTNHMPPAWINVIWRCFGRNWRIFSFLSSHLLREPPHSLFVGNFEFVFCDYSSCIPIMRKEGVSMLKD